jgi:hypothetical protein
VIKEMRLMTETAVEHAQAVQVVQAPSSAVSDEHLVAMLVDRARIVGTAASLMPGDPRFPITDKADAAGVLRGVRRT